MFLSATLTYGVIILSLGWWFWHVWRKAMNMKVDPVEEKLFNVKQSASAASVKKNCNCEKQPCECVSNTQAKRAAKLAKATAQSERLKRIVPSTLTKKTKNQLTEGSKTTRPTNPTTRSTQPPGQENGQHHSTLGNPAHSGKKNPQPKFNVIELPQDDPSEDEENLHEKLPEKWQHALKTQMTIWNGMKEIDRLEITNQLKKLTNTFNKLRVQRDKLLALSSSSRGDRGHSILNKFSVFEETSISEIEDSDDDLILALAILKSEDYCPLEKIEFVKMLNNDLEQELYRLGDQAPLNSTKTQPHKKVGKTKGTLGVSAQGGSAQGGSAQGGSAQGGYGATTASSSRYRDDWIPGLPLNL